MNPRQHALYARLLIEACGGPKEAAEACRVSEAQLSKYCEPQYGCFMPADVIDQLEAYCGQPIYSRALFEARPALSSGNVVQEACEAVEHGAAFMGQVMRALENGDVTPREADDLERLAVRFEQQARDAHEAVRQLRSAA